MRVLRLPASAFPVFYVFTSRLHAAPRLLRVSPWRSWRTRGCPPGQEICSTGFPVPVPSPAWANTGSHRFPGDPSRIFPPAPNPGRIRAASPWRSPRCCPRLKGRRRLPRVMISWPLSRGFIPAAYASRVSLLNPCKARFRLADLPLPGGSSTLWIATKGFNIYIGFPFPGLPIAAFLHRR